MDTIRFAFLPLLFWLSGIFLRLSFVLILHALLSTFEYLVHSFSLLYSNTPIFVIIVLCMYFYLTN